MFLFSLGEGQNTDIMACYDIIKILDTQLRRKSELEYKWQFLLFCEITYHHIIEGTNPSYEYRKFMGLDSWLKNIHQKSSLRKLLKI